MLLCTQYTGIEDRVGRIDDVKRELQAVIDAPPTSIHPDDREGYLNALMADLEDKEGATYTKWPEDVYLQALAAVRILCRNPMGSTTLLSTPHLSTLTHHSALPFPPPASPFSNPPPSPESATVTESLKILANLLVLHAAGRNRFAKLGGGKAIARALAGKNEDGEVQDIEDSPERLFLLGRLAFLVSIDKKDVVELMVDKENIIDSLVYHLTNLQPVQANYMALTELLKLANNLIRYYGAESSGLNTSNNKFDPLLQPVLNLFHLLPTTDLAPPLSSVIHVLFSLPFSSHLLPIWHSIPEDPSTSPEISPMKNIMSKISQLSTNASNGMAAATANARRSFSLARPSMDELESSASLHPARSKSPVFGRSKSPVFGRPKSPSPSTSSSPQKSRIATNRVAHLPSTTMDIGAFPRKLFKVLNGWFDVYLPDGKKPDEINESLIIDEVLPPVLLLAARAAEGSEEFREWMKETLLPSNLDRSTAAGPLESRKGLLGNLLRLMQCSKHFASRDSAGELLWQICGADPSSLTAEIGYGNAAGFLFQKGITGPPPGKITEIHDIPTTSTIDSPSDHPTDTLSSKSPQTPASIPPITPQSTSPSTPSKGRSLHGKETSNTSTHLHPISALNEPLPQSDDSGMTQIEKEREAERLFVLFDRLEKNPVISMNADDKSSERGKGKKIEDLMREKLGERGEEWEKKDEEDERREREEEERRDEEEALRDLRAYKERTGK